MSRVKVSIRTEWPQEACAVPYARLCVGVDGFLSGRRSPGIDEHPWEAHEEQGHRGLLLESPAGGVSGALSAILVRQGDMGQRHTCMLIEGMN
jgi:hypothetical protein